MKQIRLAGITMLLAASALLSSCSKDDDEAAVNTNTSASLDAGRAGIVFNTNTNFVSNTAFNVRNSLATTATSTVNGATRIIVLTALEINGTSPVRRASVALTMPATSNTTAGNLTADLSVPASSTIIASVALTSESGSTAGTTYSSETGTLTITKLTATEIEGSFSGTVTDGTTSYIVSNGSFAGKF